MLIDADIRQWNSDLVDGIFAPEESALIKKSRSEGAKPRTHCIGHWHRTTTIPASQVTGFLKRRLRCGLWQIQNLRKWIYGRRFGLLRFWKRWRIICGEHAEIPYQQKPIWYAGLSLLMTYVIVVMVLQKLWSTLRGNVQKLMWLWMIGFYLSIKFQLIFLWTN